MKAKVWLNFHKLV